MDFFKENIKKGDKYLTKMDKETKEYILTKPNKFIDKPLIEGLSFTALDFALLIDVLTSLCIRFAEDGSETYDEYQQNRIGEMMDEISKLYSESDYAKEKKRRLELRKKLREEENEEK